MLLLLLFLAPSCAFRSSTSYSLHRNFQPHSAGKTTAAGARVAAVLSGERCGNYYYTVTGTTRSYDRSVRLCSVDQKGVDEIPPNPNPNHNHNPNPLLSSYALLALLPVIWGTQHPIVKQFASTDSSTFTFLRFFLATLFSSLTSLLPKSSKFPLSPPTTTPSFAAELGIYMFCGYALQAVSMATIPASVSAFILYLNVKFVPFFDRILFGSRITAKTWASAAAAIFGTGLLLLGSPASTSTSASSTSIVNDGGGYVLSILAAAASAMFILRLRDATNVSPSPSSSNKVDLTTGLLLVVTTLSFCWTFLAHDLSPWQSIKTQAITNIVPLLYLSSVCTVLATFIQAIGQKSVEPAKAALIFASDPIFAAFFSYLLLGEQLAPIGVLGGGVILGAAVLGVSDNAETAKK